MDLSGEKSRVMKGGLQCRAFRNATLHNRQATPTVATTATLQCCFLMMDLFAMEDNEVENSRRITSRHKSWNGSLSSNAGTQILDLAHYSAEFICAFFLKDVVGPQVARRSVVKNILTASNACRLHTPSVLLVFVECHFGAKGRHTMKDGGA